MQLSHGVTVCGSKLYLVLLLSFSCHGNFFGFGSWFLPWQSLNPAKTYSASAWERWALSTIFEHKSEKDFALIPPWHLSRQCRRFLMAEARHSPISKFRSITGLHFSSQAFKCGPYLLVSGRHFRFVMLTEPTLLRPGKDVPE